MDPRLGTRGSNDLGGAMFQGGHIQMHIQATYYPTGPSSKPGLIGGPAFLIRQKGRKKARA